MRLHSAFIAELLNPHGNHGVKDEFLLAFLKIIGKENAGFIQPDKVNPPITERYIGIKTKSTGGRIDIIIEDGNHAVIIENKIYAGDQENQLLRYNNHGKTKFPKGHVLIYLTLDGYEPSKFSTNNETLQYISLSYRTDILQWLGECVRIAYDKPLVRETIIQYMDLIKQLTNQNMETMDKDQVINLAFENIEAITKLGEVENDIRDKLIHECIFPQLKTYAAENSLWIDTRNDGIIFKKHEWNNNCISIISDNGGWWNLYIYIKSSIETKGEQLDCLGGKPTKHCPYGWEYLETSNWEKATSFAAMKNGKVTKWIIDKIIIILREIEKKQIPM